jgi:hypothetical protein
MVLNSKSNNDIAPINPPPPPSLSPTMVASGSFYLTPQIALFRGLNCDSFKKLFSTSKRK